MDKDICRAITYINYHVPPVVEKEVPPYITLGFFDGMLTERLEVSYEEQELKSLWKYGIKRTDKQLGQYSYQNIFCISRDEWNPCSDEKFWTEDTNKEYPLTFIVFLQLREYMAGDNAIEVQCRKFNDAALKRLGNDGLCYTYDTIDKNDFVVCLKCRQYNTAVNAIKSLHRTGAEIIYSYSVFSVSRKVLAELRDKRYQYIFEEEISSICLKGITNSYDLQNGVTLDQKYNEYCERLMDKLYEEQEEEKKDFRIYDILGDNDFRLVARYVKLGKLLEQFAPGGLMCYEEGAFRFYFFSSNVVLNTLPEETFGKINGDYIRNSDKTMKEKFCSPICDRLEARMTNIKQIVMEERQCDERVITFCHALWQLLQSLKPLETAPTKRYDFLSLYIPFSALVDILEEKLGKAWEPGASEKDKDFIGNEEIYNFIHKISMTLHGTLRTDIQFFQIRDFNVIVHYAPAKLRAFYSFWVLKLSDYYNEFNEQDKKNNYSFIFSPGMYQQTGVSELYMNYVETKRLMLIKMPERHLYAVRWLPVILAHEVSHFVGYASRQRIHRHFACLKVCTRVLFLETNFYRYFIGRWNWRPILEEGVRNLKLYDEMEKELEAEEFLIRTNSNLYPHEFHSENSIRIIEETFRNGNGRFTDKIISDDSERMDSYLKNCDKKDNMSTEQRCNELRRILEDSKLQYKKLLTLTQKFQFDLLPQLLEMLMYICKEAYADLIAILTLGLSPEEYIFSFIKGECNIQEGRVADEEEVMLVLRAGYTIQAVMNIVVHKPSCLEGEFCVRWSGEVLKKLIMSLGIDTPEGKIAIDIYGYNSGIRDCNQEIQSYRPMYNGWSGCFSNNIVDFFNDKVVWESLIGYLDQSARVYVEILSSKEQLRHMRQELRKTYDRVAKESVISMSQEIENFLAKFEAERKEV